MAGRKVKVAVVGAGYFGSVHCRKISAIQQAELCAVVDHDESRAHRATENTRARPLASHRQLTGLADAAVVAVPTSQHYQVARDLAELGIHLLVEKPLAASTSQADSLCRLAEQRRIMLQVGHLERFNPLWRELVRQASKPRHIKVVRCGPYPGRGGDVDVVREVMVHDLDMVLKLAGAPPTSVSASGRSLCTPHLDRVETRISFASGLEAELLASRNEDRTVRRVEIVDDRGSLLLDLVERRLTRTISSGTSHEIACSTDEDPLYQQDLSFVLALCDGRRPAVSGREATRAVDLAEWVHRAASGEERH